MMRVFQDIWGDVCFATRQLRGTPGFTAVAVITIALGIGVNCAIFALVDATLLRPLPLPESDRLVMIWERSASTPRGPVSPLNLIDYAERARTFEVISGYAPGVGGMVMAGERGMAENIDRQWLPSARIFDALGVHAILGRTFQTADESARANIVVLSERFWQSRFGADPSIVGRDLRLDGDAFTVVGVVPEPAHLLGDTDLWALRPFSRDPALRAPRVLRAVGRMRAGVTLEDATADLASIAAALAEEYPEVNAGRGVLLEPLRDALVGADLRRTSLLFVGVVGLVLLICCANVANLLLARATVRHHELAIRVALGAGRWRVTRQLITESLLLSMIGAALGVAIGAAILSVAPSVIPQGLLPGSVVLSFDVRLVIFATAAALFAGVVFGLAPVWHARTLASPQASAGETRTTTGRGGAMRNLLVASEIATAVLLLVGAGLLLRTLLAVDRVDRGYRADDALTMVVDPMASSYPTPALLEGFFDEVEREIRTLPGVSEVAWASTLPFGPSYAGAFAFEIVGAPPRAAGDDATADLQIVSDTYFRTLDLDLVAGRPFTRHDTRQTVPVCIVNEAFVRTQLQGRSPLGLRVSLRPAGAPRAKPMVREIVGVARQVKGRPDETEAFLQVYVPMTQLIMDDVFLLVRAAGVPPATLASPVRAAIGRVDAAQLVSVRNVQTLDDIAAVATSRQRFRAVLVMTFATLALLLAMVGVFGTLAYSVQQRVRELSLRIALGATRANVVRLVAGDSLRVIGASAAVGLILAALASGLLTNMLIAIEPLDPLTFAGVVSVVGLTAILAIVVPVLRAVRVDPAAVLRAE